MIWVILVLILLYFILIRPFLKYRSVENKFSYDVLPFEIKKLIVEEKVFELSELLVRLEIEQKYDLARIILDAINHKGFTFRNRVDKVRNEMRIQAGLGHLKHF